jgi:large subunit ribosomal protein L30
MVNSESSTFNFQLSTLNYKKVMAKIKITQVKSVIDRPERQKKTMQALGLRKMNASVEVEATPQILGMVTKVNHLVTVQELA